MSWGAREGPTEKDKAGEEVNPDDGGTSGKLHPRQREWRVQRRLGRSWPGPGAARLRWGRRRAAWVRAQLSLQVRWEPLEDLEWKTEVT